MVYKHRRNGDWVVEDNREGDETHKAIAGTSVWN
jgi:hypothetical protein